DSITLISPPVINFPHLKSCYTHVYLRNNNAIPLYAKGKSSENTTIVSPVFSIIPPKSTAIFTVQIDADDRRINGEMQITKFTLGAFPETETARSYFEECSNPQYNGILHSYGM
ncbi:hypothetical protein PENTCL1PPCAC_11417, partial [Pristionchus entomophagus]